MKIALCGSLYFYSKMVEIKEKLEAKGHEVELPPTKIKDKQGKIISVEEFYRKRKNEKDEKSWIWDRKGEVMREHFKKIENCDGILVLNFDKNNIPNYIGANTLIEIGLAFHLNKKIFLLRDVPEIDYKEEILAMKPIILREDLNKIN